MALVKTTKVGGLREDATLQFRTEFFNAFNHPQFNNPARKLCARQLRADYDCLGESSPDSICAEVRILGTWRSANKSNEEDGAS